MQITGQQVRAVEHTFNNAFQKCTKVIDSTSADQLEKLNVGEIMADLAFMPAKTVIPTRANAIAKDNASIVGYFGYQGSGFSHKDPRWKPDLDATKIVLGKTSGLFFGDTTFEHRRQGDKCACEFAVIVELDEKQMPRLSCLHSIDKLHAITINTPGTDGQVCQKIKALANDVFQVRGTRSFDAFVQKAASETYFKDIKFAIDDSSSLTTGDKQNTVHAALLSWVDGDRVYDRRVTILTNETAGTTSVADTRMSMHPKEPEGRNLSQDEIASRKTLAL